MSTKTMKILITIATMCLIISMGVSVVLATDESGSISPSSLSANYSGTGGIQTIGQKIMGIIQTAGVVIAVIVLMVLGIKYMMGSAEEKAEYKKTMIPYLVGAILIFAATTIANVIYNFANGLQDSTAAASIENVVYNLAAILTTTAV